MENIIKTAKLFIYNITIILTQLNNIQEDINYIPYDVELLKSDGKRMTYKVQINKLFINSDNSIKMLNNYDFIEKLLLDYLYTDNIEIKNKIKEVFDDEIKLMMSNYNQFSIFKYIEKKNVKNNKF